MQLDPSLEELAGSMTHQPEQKTPFQNFLDYARQPAPPRPPLPGQERINQAIARQDPRYIPMQPPQQQNWQRWAEEVIGNIPIGLIGSIEWTPKELALLKQSYGSKEFEQSAFPDRTPQGVRSKAFQLGLKRPEIPPYVRQPGVPAIANSEWKVGLIDSMLQQKYRPEEIAKTLKISDRTLRRYLSENLNIRRKQTSLSTQAWSGTPSMPSFQSAIGPAMGDAEYEKVLRDFLEKNPEYR